MQEFLDNITSISWWFGVVVVGIFTSLISFSLAPKIEVWLSHISRRSREKSEKKKTRLGDSCTKASKQPIGTAVTCSIHKHLIS